MQLFERYQEQIQIILKKYPDLKKRSAVMPLLNFVQKEEGWITRDHIYAIAEICEITSTEVASIAGFYTLFHQTKKGRYRIQVCTDLSCALRGSEKFLKDLLAYLGVGLGETTDDGLFVVEEVKCIAACHRAPVFQIQGVGEIRYYENQSIETVKKIINDLRMINKEENYGKMSDQ